MQFRHHLQYARINSFESFKKYTEENHETFQQRHIQESKLLSNKISINAFAGWEILSERRTQFYIPIIKRFSKSINIREELMCRKSKINCRMRASLALFKILTHKKDIEDLRIYFTEQRTHLFKYFKSNYPKCQLIGSEYIDSQLDSGIIHGGIRHEDLTRLSFEDNSFDVIVCLEVLEHIPDFMTALKECHRVLSPNGIAIFSAPFNVNNEKNLIRARIKPDRSIEHILEPEYHGDPNNKSGILCFQHFGWEILNQLKTIGFKEVNAVSMWSKDYGILGGHQVQWYAIK